MNTFERGKASEMDQTVLICDPYGNVKFVKKSYRKSFIF